MAMMTKSWNMEVSNIAQQESLKAAEDAFAANSSRAEESKRQAQALNQQLANAQAALMWAEEEKDVLRRELETEQALRRQEVKVLHEQMSQGSVEIEIQRAEKRELEEEVRAFVASLQKEVSPLHTAKKARVSGLPKSSL